MAVVGQIIGGEYGELYIRQKAGKTIEIGELLSVGGNVILQVHDLGYQSLMEDDDLARISGMQLEGYQDTSLMEEEIRNYINAKAKLLVHVKEGEAKIPKKLPPFFNQIQRVKEDHFHFMDEPENGLYLGKIRSGSRVLDVPVYIDGKKALSHHILIPATTGRGKSNLVKVMLWNLIPKDYCGMLIIDPHDEYYGRNEIGVKDHPKAQSKMEYYSPNSPKGGFSLKLNIDLLKPWDLSGIIDLTSAQTDAMYVYYEEYRDKWLTNIYLSSEDEAKLHGIQETTLDVLRRKLSLAIDVHREDGRVYCRSGIFTTKGNVNMLNQIVDSMELGKTIILDTSSMPQDKELLIAGMITNRVFNRYKRYKESGELDGKPTISIVIEEAPRVLGERAGRNVFHTIAREGRKFRVGLIAITQLSSMIPRELLANMNTKIILGNEMRSEREAIIGSVAQDLSKDSKNIASLDKGEAIVSSIFTKFAVPIKIDLFDDIAEIEGKKKLKFF
ncbi:MAG: DUF87 domain-containing protein [Thermoplasmata archaeon]